MVEFKDLRVSAEGKLIIYVEIPEHCANICLDSISISTQDTFYKENINDNPKVAVYEVEDEKTQYYLELSSKDIMDTSENSLEVDVNKDLLYIKVITKVCSGATEHADPSITLAVVFNKNRLYNKLIKYIKELECCCEYPKNFVNYWLKYKVVETALNTGHYMIANKYWNKFLKK